jgi:hypothetical protein
MRSTRHRRSLALVLVLGVTALTLSGAAFGASTAKHCKHHAVRVVRVHRIVRTVRTVRVVKTVKIAKAHVPRRPVRRTFAPVRITRAAEVSAVVLDTVTQRFMQVTFDRGRATAVSSSSITLQQKQNAAVWRTETFTVPSTAVVTLNGRAVSLTQIPTGSAVRIESSGAVGGAQSVVRVNAYSHREAPMPASS